VPGGSGSYYKSPFLGLKEGQWENKLSQKISTKKYRGRGVKLTPPPSRNKVKVKKVWRVPL